VQHTAVDCSVTVIYVVMVTLLVRRHYCAVTALSTSDATASKVYVVAVPGTIVSTLLSRLHPIAQLLGEPQHIIKRLQPKAES
jgi:hypothetical protein